MPFCECIEFNTKFTDLESFPQRQTDQKVIKDSA